jgi:hypothetical protein
MTAPVSEEKVSGSEEIPMMAPVTSEKISMTAPVTEEQAGERVPNLLRYAIEIHDRVAPGAARSANHV